MAGKKQNSISNQFDQASTQALGELASNITVTSAQAAELMGVTREHLDVIVSRGQLTRIKGRIRIQAIVDWMRTRRSRGRPAKGCQWCSEGEGEVKVMEMAGGMVRVEMCRGCLEKVMGVLVK